MTYPKYSPRTAEQDGSDTSNAAESRPDDGSEHEDGLDEQCDFSAREPVLMRGMRVLEAFTDTAEPLRLSEIKRRSDLPMTTTHRLVGALVAAGALEQVGPRRYQVGTRLVAVVNAGHIAERRPVP